MRRYTKSCRRHLLIADSVFPIDVQLDKDNRFISQRPGDPARNPINAPPRRAITVPSPLHRRRITVPRQTR